MKNTYLLLAGIAIALCSCSKTTLPETETTNASFTAISSTDTPDTKTGIFYEDGQYKMKWVSGEEVAVYHSSAPATKDATYNISYPKYFRNATPGVNTSARFTPVSDFWTDDFESTERYVITYNGTPESGVYSSSGSTAVNFIYYYLVIPLTQTYTPAEPFCIARNIIPLYGGVYCDGNADKNAVALKHASSIINLTLTNSMGAPVTIKKVVLSSTVGTGRDGIAGARLISYAGGSGNITVQSGSSAMGGGGQNTITLNCPEGKRPTIADGDSASFGFLLGNGAVGTLTWTAYDETDTAIGKPVSVNLTSKNLVPGYYYTISRALSSL